MTEKIRQTLVKVSVAVAMMAATWGASAQVYKPKHMVAFIIGVVWMSLVTIATFKYACKPHRNHKKSRHLVEQATAKERS